MRCLPGWYSALYSLIQQQFKQLIQIDSESTDQQIWLKDVSNHILFFQVTLCASKIVLFEFYKNLVFSKLPHHSLCLILSKLHRHHLTCGWFTQTQQIKHKGRQLNELSFLNLCMMYIYHATFHLKLSQCVSKILQYH